MFATNRFQSFVLRLVACCLLLSSAVVLAQTQRLSGTVTIAGSENSALATIRIVDQGIGTTSKLDGTYYLEDIQPGQHTVEYSYIGHKTVRQQLTWTRGEAKLLDVAMEEAPILLTTAFVTPNGEDAAVYILNHVWKNAEQKRAKLPAFETKTQMVLSYTDFDILLFYEFLPRIARMTIMGIATVAGLKSFVKLLMAHPELNVTTQSDLHYQKKKFKWDNFAIARCNNTLTADEKKTLYKMSDGDDLYEMVYGDENKLRSRKTRKELKGSYEDGDRMIYVIEGTKDDERYTMHIVEDSWDVLKLEKKDDMELTQIECRPAPGGLYLPVSINTRLTFIDATAEKLRESLEDAPGDEEEYLPEEDGKKASKMAEKMANRINDNPEKKERIRQFFERIQTDGIHMVINHGMSISYPSKH